jgi:hypothetical protein
VLVQLVSQAQIFGDPVMVAALVFAVGGPTVFAFSALSYSSQKLKPSINSAYITLQPVLVAVASLLLFGTVLTYEEMGSGLTVLFGLYLSIIGNPQVDRAWTEYMSDLPANVPQSIASVADAGVGAAVTVTGKVRDIGSDVRGRVGDIISQSTDVLDEQVTKALSTADLWQSDHEGNEDVQTQPTALGKPVDGLRGDHEDGQKSHLQ